MKEKKMMQKILIVLLLLIQVKAAVPQGYDDVLKQYQMKDTKNKELSKTIMVDNQKIKVFMEKENEGKDVQMANIFIFRDSYGIGDLRYGQGIYIYDQYIIATACIDKQKNLIFTTMLSSSSRQHEILYAPFITQIPKQKNGLYNDAESINGNHAFEEFAVTSVPTYNPKKFFPYYNEQKILARLYETGTCSQEATEKANIQVPVNGKWIPQEQSWNLQNNSNGISNTSTPVNQLTIQQTKQPLYKNPSEDGKTKMYLIAGDKVELLETKDNWFHIVYHGKKDIDAWIPKEAVK